MSPVQRSLHALGALAWPTPATTPQWAHGGPLAGRIYGLAARIERLEVIATGPLPPQVTDTEPIGTDGGLWTPDGGLPIIWRCREDSYKPFWCALVASQVENMLSGPALVALHLQSRGREALVVALIMAGLIDVEACRGFVLTHLGPYALDDLEGLIQEAEWQLMRQRYTADGDVH